MLVRLFLTSFALLLMLPLSPLTARALSFNARVLVNSVVLSWESVDGAQWYDIYNGEAFVVRLPSTENTYTVEHLAQDSGFRFVLGARDGDNNTLDAEAVSVTTGNYSGLYRWENQTDDDNGGMIEINITVPGSITSISGAVQTGDNTLTFSFPLIDFLLLAEPLAFSVQWN